MSNMAVRTNVMSINSHRNLGIVGNMQNRASQRLSSGFRINSAADDAAGLAISEKMRAQIRGLDQASRNGQDGISLIQTAEGAMNIVNDMVIRIRELVVQAANDTNAHDGANLPQSDRIQIQREINALMDEIDDITLRTEFNTRTLLDGTWSRGEITRAPGSGGTTPVDFSLSNVLDLDAFLGAIAMDNFEMGVNGVAGSLFQWGTAAGLQVAAIEANLNDGFELRSGVNQTALQNQILNTIRETIADVVGYGGNAMAPVEAEFSVAIQGWLTQESGYLASTVHNLNTLFTETTAEAVAAQEVLLDAIAMALGSVDVAAFVRETPVIPTTFGESWNFAGSPGAVNGVFNVLDPRHFTDSAAAGVAFNEALARFFLEHDGAMAGFADGFTVAEALTWVGAMAQGFFAMADGTAIATDVDLNADTARFQGLLDSLTNDAPGTRVTVGVAATHLSEAGIEFLTNLRSALDEALNPYLVNGPAPEEGPEAPAGGNALWFQIGANSGQGVRLNIEAVNVANLTAIGADVTRDVSRMEGGTLIEETISAATEGIRFSDLRNAALADNSGVMLQHGQDINNFLVGIDAALAHVAGERANLGAMQNRLEFTIENLDIASENLNAANSRIRDADMAQEMMRFTQSNVLQQAAISMLAQANQAPQSILQLLR